MISNVNCPFCEGDIDGCCFCEHTGKVSIGDGGRFKSQTEIDNSVGVSFLKMQDEKQGLEYWPEMIDFFLDEKNVPEWYKNEYNKTLTNEQQQAYERGSTFGGCQSFPHRR